MSIKHKGETVLQNFVNVPITSTINASSTNEECAGAKAVYDIVPTSEDIKNIVKRVDLICPSDKSPRDFAIENATGNNYIIHFRGWDNNNDTPAVYADYTFIRLTDARNGYLICYSSGGTIFISNLITTSPTNQWSEWKKINLTSVADISLTALDVSNISNYSKGSIYYQVKNGVAYVQIYDLLTTNAINTAINISGLPSPNMYAHSILENMGVIRGIISCPQGGTTFSYYKASDDATLGGYCSFSYPVATS